MTAARFLIERGADDVSTTPHTTYGGLRIALTWRATLLLAGGLLLAAGCNNIAAQGRNAEGVRLFQQGRYPEALQQFQEAAYTDPANADGYYNLAATYHRLGRTQNRPTDLAQAETHYYQCLDRNPNHRDAHRGLAVLLAEQSRTDEAFRLMQRWADQQPATADAKIELARLYEEFGNRAAAKERLTEALAVEPNNPRAWAALGKIREETGESSQALANYQRSLSSDQFQPAVASRISALQSTTPTATTTPDSLGPPRVVTGPTTPLR
jgi:Tfp pilus assembly protein PilF